MKKNLYLPCLFMTTCCTVNADVTGIFVGGGIGYGMQNQSYFQANTTEASPALRLNIGYQLADWLGAEVGWNYLSQTQNWKNLGLSSSTIYDLSFTPGFSFPGTPITLFTRLGINATSTNLNSSWYNQLWSNSKANFEYGIGLKVSIPQATNTFIRAEYINYGGQANNNNNSLITTPNVIMINAAYVF